MSLIEIEGIVKSREQWCKQLGIPTSTVTRRMQRKGMTEKEALLHKKPKTRAQQRQEEFESRPMLTCPMREIPGHPNYLATEDGRIWSVRFRRTLVNSFSDGLPYARVNIAGSVCYVHRLVCMAWHGEPTAEFNVVDHKDRDTRNNHKDNLRWTDMKGNADNRSDTVMVLHQGTEQRLQDVLISVGMEKYSTEYWRYFQRVTVTGMSIDEAFAAGEYMRKQPSK